MKIMMVIGTRPEAIKMLPLAIEMRKHGQFSLKICHSGQHAEMAREVFSFFKIEPDFCFDAMKKGQMLCEMSTRLLNYFDALFAAEKPELVLVHGDTTTAFCASLAAFYLGIEVAHVEAGLRTYNAREPFPEEFNRVAIDCISRYHFAPTELSLTRLANEGRRDAVLVGNTVIDALGYTVSKDYSSPFLSEAGKKKIILITTHRRENIGEKMRSALLGIRDVLSASDDYFAILPAHPNPAVREAVDAIFEGIKKIKICPPLPLYDFHNILARSFAVFTDSGGVQEEASALGVPVFLLRDVTERQEGEKSGNIKLVGTDRERIASEFLATVNDPEVLSKMQNKSTVFGNGDACKKIVKKLLSLT